MGIFSERLLYKFLGGRPITETTGIMLMCSDANILEPIKTTKNLKSVLTNLHRGPLKTISRAACGPRVGHPCCRSSYV